MICFNQLNIPIRMKGTKHGFRAMANDGSGL